jgi:hypothetical protein
VQNLMLMEQLDGSWPISNAFLSCAYMHTQTASNASAHDVVVWRSARRFHTRRTPMIMMMSDLGKDFSF